MSAIQPRPAVLRVLAVVRQLKWQHIAYLEALSRHFDLLVAVSGEGHKGAYKYLKDTGLRAMALPLSGATTLETLRGVLGTHEPQIIHLMYYFHEKLTILARKVAGPDVKLVFECRDPLSTMAPKTARVHALGLERAAIQASDGHIFVSRATRDYFSKRHRLDLSSALIVPHGYSRDTIVPPSEKLSRRDGRLHMALVGTAVSNPNHGRNYLQIIDQLVGLGFVVHAHFIKQGDNLEAYRRLAENLVDFHVHPTLDHRRGTKLSETMSRYDLMGVFHDLEAGTHNEADTLEVCMPTKAVCGWLHGGTPVVCFSRYRGLVELIERFGIGFAVDRLADCAALFRQRQEIERATRACLRHRHYFTNEWNAERISRYFAGLLAGKSDDGLGASPV